MATFVMDIVGSLLKDYIKYLILEAVKRKACVSSQIDIYV